MRLLLVLFCLAAMPGTAADADTYASPGAPAVDHARVSTDTRRAATASPAKRGHLATPEDYDLDHLLRCAVGCQG